MAATYDPALATNRDWVRLLVGDRDTTGAQLEDEEIDALLAEEQAQSGAGEHLKYYVAARAGEALLARHGTLVQKWVGDLKLSYNDAPESAYLRYLDGLRTRGAELRIRASGRRPAAFRVC